MGKKVVVLEDDLNKILPFARQFNAWNNTKDTTIKFEKVLYFSNTIKETQVQELPLVKKIVSENIEVVVVNIINFSEKMEELYKDADRLFIFDTYLVGDDASQFDYKVNVSYALKKQRDADSANSEMRIWFYTATGNLIKQSIKRLFKDHVIDIALEEGEYKLKFAENEAFKRFL